MPPITGKPVQVEKDEIKAFKVPYKLAAMPENARETQTELLNLQICACGHDRLVHGQFLGKGADRKVILDCPRAGLCLVRNCKCLGFQFSKKSSKVGIEHYNKEKAKNKVFPPSM